MRKLSLVTCMHHQISFDQIREYVGSSFSSRQAGEETPYLVGCIPNCPAVAQLVSKPLDLAKTTQSRSTALWSVLSMEQRMLGVLSWKHQCHQPLRKCICHRHLCLPSGSLLRSPKLVKHDLQTNCLSLSHHQAWARLLHQRAWIWSEVPYLSYFGTYH